MASIPSLPFAEPPDGDGRPLRAVPSALPADRELESYRLLAETAQLLLARGGLRDTLNRVAEALGKLVPYDGLTIYVSHNDRGLLEPVLSLGAWADEIMRDWGAFGVGGIGWAVEHREPVCINWYDIDDPRLKQVPGTTDDVESIVAVPLIARDEICGALAIYRDGEVEFRPDEVGLACLFAGQAALAIDNARAHDVLEAHARTDSVTGLYNHRYFHEQLRAELNRAHRYRHAVSVLLLDLDDFKAVNDRYGHLEGDAVLRRLGSLIVEKLRDNDVACRIGGEEFGVILPHTDAAGALELAERIRFAVAATSFGAAGSLSISGGIGSMPEDAAGPTALIDAADTALYASKRRGKNRVTVHSSGLEQERPARSLEGGAAVELAVLESIAHRIASVGDPLRIAQSIAVELRTAIDYHHCRVLLVDETGEFLEPVATHGDLLREGRQRPSLTLRVGEGVAGTCVAQGRSLLVDDAAAHPAAVTIPGTPTVEESLLAVPMRYDQRTIGAVVLSKLGLAQFTRRDQRLVEILASHAAVAFENASLSRGRQRAAVRAGALVQLAASAPERSASQLNTLRRALDADWAVVLRALETGQPLVAADVSGRPAQVRALRALELEPRPVSARLGRLSPAEAERLPEAVSRSRVVRLALGPKTLLLVGVSSAEAERAARSTLRELGLRLADLLDAVAPPAAQAPAAPAARSGKPRRRPNRISLELGAGSTHDQLAVLAQHAVDLTRADGAAIAVLDERSNMVRYVAGCGEGFEHVTEVSFPVAQSLSGEASSHGRVLVVDDYRSHPLAQPFFLDLGVRSVAVVPMTTTPGAVAVHSINRPLRFGSSQVAAMEVIAQQAGALIAQGALYDELESSYRATVEALTNALEVKDSYTSQHVREIAELALAVGQRMQLRPRRLRDLEYAAILHDIGKIGLPTALLTKPGPLDVPERELVETHTAIGHAMLKDIPFLARVADIVRSAHERWDGQGYPDRLAGDRIPLESRIIFVCDAWHAMRSDRSYRRALPPEAARAELVRHAGAQFDPSVVDVFLQHVAEREVGAQRPES